MMQFLLVALGGALGAAARHGTHLALSSLAHPFPWSTLLVNVAGSGVLGVLTGLWAARDMTHSPERLILVVGFLGAFTTFSTFAGESVDMWRNGQLGWLALHWLLHNSLSFGAALLGAWWAWSPHSSQVFQG